MLVCGSLEYYLGRHFLSHRNNVKKVAKVQESYLYFGFHMIRGVYERRNPVLKDIKKLDMMHPNGFDIAFECDLIVVVMTFRCFVSVLANSQFFLVLCCVHYLDLQHEFQSITLLLIPKSFSSKTVSAPFLHREA